MADLPVVAILRVAGQQPVLGDAVVEFAERDLLVVRADRDLVALALLLLDELVGVAVQPFGVDRVERVLHDLQPVARDERAAQHADACLRQRSRRGAAAAALIRRGRGRPRKRRPFPRPRRPAS